MDLSDYCRILRQRWSLVAVCVLVGLCTAVAVNVVKSPTYEAEAQLFATTSDKDGSNAYQGSLLTQQRVKSYTKFVDSPEVLKGVISALGLRTTTDELAGQITATAPLDTALVDIVATDGSARRAQAIANETAVQFARFVTRVEQDSKGGSPLVKVSVIRSEAPPASPTSPQPLLNIAIGLVAGLAAGLGGVVLREATDTTLRTAADLRGRLGLTTLGVLSRTSPRKWFEPLRQGSRRAEEFSRLRTAVQFIDHGRMPQSMVVASPLHAEGRTGTALGLAASLAQAGRRVVLVEGDLRHPCLATRLGLSDAVGLSTVLNDPAALDAALQVWDGTEDQAGLPHGALRVLVSGPVPPNPSELLSSSRMVELLSTLQLDADLVLLDSPPLLLFADSAELVARTDGVLIVARSGKTGRAAARQALDEMALVDGRVLGAVLTAMPARGFMSRYGRRGPTRRTSGTASGFSHGRHDSDPRGAAEPAVHRSAGGQAGLGETLHSPDQA